MDRISSALLKPAVKRAMHAGALELLAAARADRHAVPPSGISQPTARPAARPGPADLPAAPAARPPEERSRRVNPQAPHAGGRLAPPTRTGESALAPFDSQTSLMAVCVAVMNIIMCMSSTSRYL